MIFLGVLGIGSFTSCDLHGMFKVGNDPNITLFLVIFSVWTEKNRLELLSLTISCEGYCGQDVFVCLSGRAKIQSFYPAVIQSKWHIESSNKKHKKV